MKKQQLYYLPCGQINKERWDACIEGSSNGLIYGYSFYLDAMAGDWDGLILNDYEAVMPLTWRKKYGISYLYQPAFVAQEGVFGNGVAKEMVQLFLEHIPKKFRLWEFPLNQGNNFTWPEYHLHQKVNYVLDLCKDYDSLYQGYRDNHKRNIKKALSLGCALKKGIPINEVIALNKLHAGQQQVADEAYVRFASLFSILSKMGKAETYGIYHNNQLLASCCFFFSHQRAYYILVGNHPNGRTLGASHLLIDAFIKGHAGLELLLDFEGSDLRNLAFFYNGFGATEERYRMIRYNRLPWYMKMLKRT